MVRKIRVNGISKNLGEININELKSISKFGRKYPPSQKVVAIGIPTQYQRAAILKQAQAFEELSHADLIRID